MSRKAYFTLTFLRLMSCLTTAGFFYNDSWFVTHSDEHNELKIRVCLTFTYAHNIFSLMLLKFVELDGYECYNDKHIYTTMASQMISFTVKTTVILTSKSSFEQFGCI